MNSSNELKIVGEEGVLTKKISTEKQFVMDGIVWDYENNFDLSLMGEEVSPKLKIKNHLCEMEGNKIKKVTEIIYKNKKYTIEDIYSLQVPSQQGRGGLSRMMQEPKDAASTNDSDNKNEPKDKRDEPKVYIFKKMAKKKQTKQDSLEHLRNTKNITKNFCKAFLVFLKSEKVSELDRQRIRQGISIYNKLLDRYKYNNNVIKKIISNQILRDLFRIFLQRYAKTWISQSRVTDKTLHYQAISIYLNLFQSMQMVKNQKEDSSNSQLQQSDRENDNGNDLKE